MYGGWIMKKELFMKMQITESVFSVMFEEKTKSEHFIEILKTYNTNNNDLYGVLWEEFNIPGMEVRIANTAFDFLILKCVEKKELNKLLRNEIKECVLSAGIFYTNVAPEACSTSDFAPPDNSI